jgi:hypothetical protein
MAGITPSQFRLRPDTLACLDALAASNGGQRTTAVKEAVAQFRALVEQAGQANAAELSRDDWHRLANLGDPSTLDQDETEYGIDWSARLAAELVGMWAGRTIMMSAHRQEARACRALARRIAAMGRLRGYALMCALRYFWRQGDARIEECVDPGVWMTPQKRRDDCG